MIWYKGEQLRMSGCSPNSFTRQTRRQNIKTLIQLNFLPRSIGCTSLQDPTQLIVGRVFNTLNFFTACESGKTKILKGKSFTKFDLISFKFWFLFYFTRHRAQYNNQKWKVMIFQIRARIKFFLIFVVNCNRWLVEIRYLETDFWGCTLYIH